jgi:hypothetical protein
VNVSASLTPGPAPAHAEPFASRGEGQSSLPLSADEGSFQQLQDQADGDGTTPQPGRTRAAETGDEPNAPSPEKKIPRSELQVAAWREPDKFQQIMTLAFSLNQAKVSALAEPEAASGEEDAPETFPAAGPDAEARLDFNPTLAAFFVPVNIQPEAALSAVPLVPARLDQAPAKANLAFPSRADRSDHPSLPEPPGMLLKVKEPAAVEGPPVPPHDDHGIPAPAGLPQSVGTTGAKHTYDMKNAAESGPLATPTGQILPVDGELLVTIAKPEPLEASPIRFTNSGVSAAPPEFENTPAAAEIASVVSFSSSHGLEPARAALVTGSVPPPVPAATPLDTEIHSRVLEFRRSNADSMAVVLRPDANTEIHLSLRLIGGQVDVSAHWTRGDASLLQAQWSQMQESLSGQGIRLAAIPESPSLSGFGQSPPDGFRNPNQQPGTAEERFGLETFTASPVSAKPAARSTLRSNRPLLESWA